MWEQCLNFKSWRIRFQNLKVIFCAQYRVTCIVCTLIVAPDTKLGWDRRAHCAMDRCWTILGYEHELMVTKRSPILPEIYRGCRMKGEIKIMTRHFEVRVKMMSKFVSFEYYRICSNLSWDQWSIGTTKNDLLVLRVGLKAMLACVTTLSIT